MSASGSRKLVIVESPAKAKTIGRFLGSEYDVEASVGHIRDLAQPSQLPEKLKKSGYAKFAVDLENDFEPYYVVDPDKKKKVRELKKHLKNADALYLATDEDREGEAIAWHLLEELKPTVPVKRMVFHEITKDAIDAALKNPRDIDKDLVNAQETRRILDRLVGYEVSPLLWRKVRPKLSAGRVQSVATRLVVERERERIGFTPAEYWDLEATLRPQDGGSEFTAVLRGLDGRRLATGKDFDQKGNLKSAAAKANVMVLDAAAAQELVSKISAPSSEWEVEEVESKPYRRRPPAPFTTSSLQQEASRKLRMNSRDTMRVAQSLYENGYITYMRTDSVNLSQQAIAAARFLASELFGSESVEDKPRYYKTKSKGAQEAHEAIRPAGDRFRRPAELKKVLNGSEYKLYDLIFKRTLACQMKDATGTTESVRIHALSADKTATAEFGAAGTVITNPGFIAAYEEGSDEAEHGEKAGKKNETRLPELRAGQALHLVKLASDEEHQHFTQPPARYTDASLVKAMEDKGIGRPSTYASTISTIVDREYVNRRGQALVPTWLAFSVVRLLEQNLPRLVDYDFTADMEADLDKIAVGEARGTAWLKNFWFGSNGLQQTVENLSDIDAAALNSVQLGEGITLRVGRYGPYLEKDEVTASVPDSLAPDELTVEKARELLEKGAEGDRVLGVHPETGLQLVVKAGRFGPYIEEVNAQADTPAAKGSKKPKNRTASLLKSQSPETVTLDEAVALLSLPRLVGKNDEGNEILALNGRYGPYIKCGSESRSLESESQLFSLTQDEALALLKAPKKRGSVRGTSQTLMEFGADPVTGGAVALKNGRYGPYVTDGKTNATVPRGTDPASVTAAKAFEMLAEKRAKGPSKRSGRRGAKKKK